MTNRKLLSAGLAAAALALAGCGGGGADAPAPTEQVPDSASTSVGGLIAYLQALIASDAEALEPVDVGAVQAQTDETAEPQVID